MGDYFDEMGWSPLGDGEEPNHLLHFARLLRDYGIFENTHDERRFPPPAAKDAVKNLKKCVVVVKGFKCAICLTEPDLGEELTELPCKHQYHSECIMLWLNKTNSCPSCRFELPTDDENYERYRCEKQRKAKRANDLKILHDSMFT